MRTGARITVGVTGHRELPEENIPAIAQGVRDCFAGLQNTRGDSAITVLSSLAEGADILCAKMAVDMGLRLAVPLPMSKTEYRRDFSESASREFDFLLSVADEVFTVLPEEAEPGHPSRGFYYRQAGIYIAKNCDVLLAVWDGEEEDNPEGAGTWETMKLAREFGKPIQIIDSYGKGR